MHRYVLTTQVCKDPSKKTGSKKWGNRLRQEDPPHVVAPQDVIIAVVCGQPQTAGATTNGTTPLSPNDTTQPLTKQMCETAGTCSKGLKRRSWCSPALSTHRPLLHEKYPTAKYAKYEEKKSAGQLL